MSFFKRILTKELGNLRLFSADLVQHFGTTPKQISNPFALYIYCLIAVPTFA